MLEISQVANMLQSLGVASTTASKVVERVSTSANDSANDSANFVQQLQASINAFAASPGPAKSANTTDGPATSIVTGTVKPTVATQEVVTPTQTTPEVKAPFGSFEEFRTWEKGLGNTFAPDYESPDYLQTMGLCRIGGDNEAFGRYVFFKNNPAFAVDYEEIRSGSLSKFPTDGTTLVKSDLSTMPTDVSEYYKKNPAALLMAEGFNMDPTLYKMRLDGSVDVPANTNATEWLAQNRWTANGIVANNNRLTLAQADYIGLDGSGAGTYKRASFDTATGLLVDLDGKKYDPGTGKLTV